MPKTLTKQVQESIHGIDDNVVPYVLNYFTNQGIRFMVNGSGELSGKGISGSCMLDNDARELNLTLSDTPEAAQLLRDLQVVSDNVNAFLSRPSPSVLTRVQNSTRQSLFFQRFEAESGRLDGIPDSTIRSGGTGQFFVRRRSFSIGTGAIGTAVYTDSSGAIYRLRVSVPYLGENSAVPNCPASVSCSGSISSSKVADALFTLRD